jgi:extracellular elastinolytic metalloproteinase
MNRRLSLLVCLSLFGASLFAQNRLPRETALHFLQENPAQFKLSAADVSDIRVTDEFATKHNGLTHVWLQQQYHGIPVFNALLGLHVKSNGEVLHLAHRFVPDLSKHINTTLPSLSAYHAIEMAMKNLGFTGFSVPSLRQKINEQNLVFEGGAISKEPIPVSICYALQADGSVRLAWTMIITQANTSDIWNMRVDAQTGQILDKINQTVYCKAESGLAGMQKDDCTDFQVVNKNEAKALNSADESYNVFAFPTESPAHGNRQLLVNPAIPEASPYGWLDDNGQAGAEYTYSRGNNVWAYDDRASNNDPTVAESVDGGASLLFDFPFDPTAEPAVNRNAAITNLFYINNMMHDLTYLYGFDEVAGNFQANNYGQGGQGDDYVLAQALDGSGVDNANFATPADGGNGSMQMFLWGNQGGKVIKVNAPTVIQGTYEAARVTWGGAITSTPLTGSVVVVDDGTPDASLGCNPIANISGKIAIVDRGLCEFGKKALNAEQGGAIACIICNFDESGLNMGAGDVGDQVTIPVVGIPKSTCDLLRQYAGSSLNISLVLPSVSGPNQLDGDFDNGIIAHEYGHGISTRLTGGPANSGCLGNDEQMGEGWSDFFALAVTVKPGDVGTQKRGMGTFVYRQQNDGQGIRRFPYSTDMGINPLVFSSVAENTEVHALGEVWTAMLWDLYWAFVEKYGYDADWHNKNSGNARAMQLVMDGMKTQPCNPGFQDGRDAIMMADKVSYAGVDTCLISSVFARRGLGYFASQGSPGNAGDGIENFDPIPVCVKELKIVKATSTPLVDPGGFADYTVTITNHKDVAVTGVVVSDEIPAGLDFVSATNGGVASGGVVGWNLGTVQAGQVITLSYRVKVADGVKSQCYFNDPMDTDDNWFSFSIENAGADEFFSLQSADKKVGTSSWKAPENGSQFTDFTLELQNTVITVFGAKPVLRFWHKYNTEASADAGFIEIQLLDDPSMKWRRVNPEKMVRNPYTGKVQYGTFVIPFLYGFSGNSNGWVQSYLDLSEYIGKDINLRFRFGTDDNTAVANGAWFMDELQIIDMVNFNSYAKVMSAEGDVATSTLAQGGVIINTSCAVVETSEAVKNQVSMSVQPNPAQDVLSVTLNQAIQGNVKVSLVSAEGRTVYQNNYNSIYEGQVIALDVSNTPTGMYVVRVESNAGTSMAKVVIQ